jgi:hypothetical protein
MDEHEELLHRAETYARRQAVALTDTHGHGSQGPVFFTSRRSAVKVFLRERHYSRERDVYLRLRDRGVAQVRGCNVPLVLGFDDELRVIEMTTVARPFALDFASAYLDEKPPEFSDEVLADWLAEKRERFGADWREVELVIAAFERYGIYLSDVHPGNISLRHVDGE